MEGRRKGKRKSPSPDQERKKAYDPADDEETVQESKHAVSENTRISGRSYRQPGRGMPLESSRRHHLREMRENPYPSLDSDITFADDQSLSSDLDIDDDVVKKRYQEKIKELVGREGEGRPLRVAVIGAPGAGKSSFINTIGAAFRSDRWREFASYGHHGGDADPISTFTVTFKKCCNEESYCDYKLPTLIDIAGIPDEDKEMWRELLRIIFYGRLLEGEALGQAQEMCEREGLHKMYEHYSQRKENLKVDRIIFVASATQDVPKNLINSVLAAAKPSGRGSNPATRTIPVFAVLTKKDKFPQDDSTLKTRQTELMKALGLGNAGHRFLLCSNYCDDVDGGVRTERVLPQLDVPVLKFLYQVFDPVIKVLNDPETMVEALQNPTLRRALAAAEPEPAPAAEQGARAGPGAMGGVQADGARAAWLNLLQQVGLTTGSTGLVLMAVEAVLVAAIFLYMIQPVVDVSSLRASCTAFSDRHLYSTDPLEHVPRLQEICNNLDATESTRKIQQVFCLMLLLLLRVVVTFLGNVLQVRP